jgi:hypothetical protein
MPTPEKNASVLQWVKPGGAGVGSAVAEMGLLVAGDDDGTYARDGLDTALDVSALDTLVFAWKTDDAYTEFFVNAPGWENKAQSDTSWSIVFADLRDTTSDTLLTLAVANLVRGEYDEDAPPDRESATLPAQYPIAGKRYEMVLGRSE